MMKDIKYTNFLKEIIAGMLIALGGIIFLSIENKVVGALFFAFGLLTICNLKFILYTGRIGYFFEQSGKGKLDYLLILLFNILGVLLMSSLIYLTNNSALESKVLALAPIKMAENYFEVFVRAILCGFMMVLAVEGFKRFEGTFLKTIAVVISVAIFILAGFEHSIANIFYLSYAGFCGYEITFEVILKLFITVLGNSVGSIALYELLKLSLKDKENIVS